MIPVTFPIPSRRAATLLLVVLLLSLAGIAAAASAAPVNSFRGNNQSSVDIDVTVISQSPRYNFDAAKNNPAAGDQVTFTASVRNRGTAATGAYSYQWYVDGVAIASGTAPTMATGSEVKFNQNWTWQSGDHDISFFADPANAISEKSEQNNLRTIRTTGLRVGFWVEQSVRNYFDTYQYPYTQQFGIADEANSWEDWAQRQIDTANRVFAEAR
ncbi:MAG: hypothetical protein LUQ58_00075, partial [Methanomicrobiales archaeon]|nr:hypothetical protein [Methanomicrobiales archaeon]